MLLICSVALFPTLRLTFFAPWIVIVFYRKSLLNALWASVLCGIVIDLLASDTLFGIYACNYALTTWILYSYKRNFFEDNLSTLPMMAYFYSILSTLLQVILLYVFQEGLNISWQWIGTDMLLMPALDACYAFLIFVLPGFFTKPVYDMENA